MSLKTTDNYDLLLLTGAPDNPTDDSRLARFVAEAPKGCKIVIMGGTTAKIIARELARELTVNLRPDPSGMPPTSYINGVDIVSEGVLTLMATRDLLKEGYILKSTDRGVKYDIFKLLTSAHRVHFVEGMKINPTHFLPNLPVRLEHRCDLLEQVMRILATQYQVHIEHTQI